MLATRKRGSPTLVAENGNPDLGKCQRRMVEEKKWYSLGPREKRVHQICSFMWADIFWIMSHSKEIVEQMFRDLIVEASRWDLETSRFVVDKYVDATHFLLKILSRYWVAL